MMAPTDPLTHLRTLLNEGRFREAVDWRRGAEPVLELWIGRRAEGPPVGVDQHNPTAGLGDSGHLVDGLLRVCEVLEHAFAAHRVELAVSGSTH